tara:strand:+ start:15741 stop:15980 length:240 start_codon:yes stop_codon:yes gene_type:complete
MKVFIEYMVSVSALVEKEVPEGTSYDEVINSVTREELVEADVQEVEWGHLKDAWRCEDHPNVYKADDDGNVDWSERMED